MKKTLILLTLGIMLLSIPASAGTVAWWRFEAGPVNTQVQSSANGPAWSADVPDSSGNGNELSVWDSTQFMYRDGVPYSTIPLTGEKNNFSAKNTTGGPAMWTSSDDPINTITPAEWTIEATFKLENGEHRTIIGRDSYGTNTAGNTPNPSLSALYFQATPGNRVAIKFCDVDGYWHDAISAENAITSFDFGSDNDGLTAPYYSMAAVSDGTLLSLYLLNHDTPELGYQLVAQTDMTVTNPGSTNTAMTAGAGSGSDWDAGNFTVTRGLYNSGHGDRAWGYVDEVRISDSALSVDEFLVSSFAQPSSPAQDEYLATQAAITYSWTSSALDPEAVFGYYTVYIAEDAADLTPTVPTTTLDSAVVTDIESTSYDGYGEGYDYNEDYYWRVDATILDPNYDVPDPNFPEYNIENLIQGIPVRFFGPRACPAVEIVSDDFSNLPDSVDHSFMLQDAVFTAEITRGTVDVDAITWYKVVGVQDDLETVDPNDIADLPVSPSAGEIVITYDPDLTNATSTTLTFLSADPTDNGQYYARVRLVDPLGGGTGCEANSDTVDLFVRDDTNAGTDYLVHRYGFDGNANDSIGGANGTVVDGLDETNYAFADGQLELFNGDLTSGPTEEVEFPDPTSGEPNATIILNKLLDLEGAYVDLPNGIISPLGKSATFMVWFTYDRVDTGNWPRLFDFGTSAAGEDYATGGNAIQEIEGEMYLAENTGQQEYIMMTPKVDAGPAWRFETRAIPPMSNIATEMGDNGAIATGTEVCVACVFDAANGVQTVYVNGVQVGESAVVEHNLSNIDDVNNWIGRSQFNDAMFSGKINELRIYDIPLSKYWVKAYADQGADDYLTTPNPCILDEDNPMDFNTDCVVDMLDFAEFALEWLECGRLYGCN